MPCGELIEDGDYNHPSSEQQPWFTKAEQLLHNTTAFLLHPNCGVGMHLAHPSHLKDESPVRFSTSLFVKENLASCACTRCIYWLSSIPALMSIWQCGIEPTP